MTPINSTDASLSLWFIGCDGAELICQPSRECPEMQMQRALIYFSSRHISDFEFHPPAMDWTRGFSVAFKAGAAACTMTFSAFHLALVFFLSLLGCDIWFQWDHRDSHIVTFLCVNTLTTNCLEVQTNFDWFQRFAIKGRKPAQMLLFCYFCLVLFFALT